MFGSNMYLKYLLKIKWTCHRIVLPVILLLLIINAAESTSSHKQYSTSKKNIPIEKSSIQVALYSNIQITQNLNRINKSDHSLGGFIKTKLGILTSIILMIMILVPIIDFAFMINSRIKKKN